MGNYFKPRSVLILFVVSSIFLLANFAGAATYDATGEWDFSYSNAWGDCEIITPSSNTVTITQIGNNVTLVSHDDSGDTTYTGSVTNNIYNLTVSFQEGGGILTQNIIFILTSNNTGIGNLTSIWTNGIVTCKGGFDIYWLRQGHVFADIPPGFWAKDAIYKIYCAGITKGCSQTPLMYCPNDTVTRTQMAVFLGRGKHGSSFTPPSATGIFADVPVSYWAADWIEQFYNYGITTGCGTNPLRYCPGNNVTRAQMAIFLLRVKHGKNYTPPAASGIFSDVPVTYWAADWIEQLYHEGITTGCSTGPLRYCPENSVTRAQMAVFITRTFGL